MTRYKTHRFDEYGDTEGLREYYQVNDWSSFAQKERDDATIELGKTFEHSIDSVGDFSAGGSRIAFEIGAHYGVRPTLGDLGNQYGYGFVGTLQETLPAQDIFDLYICTETVEHLPDPDADLRLIRQHCRYLLLSTPVMEEPHLVSHGHLWTWRKEDVEEMLVNAGFDPYHYLEISIFGIWKCR